MDVATIGDPRAIVDVIVRLFRDHGQRRYSEAVSQEEHALQCARLAQQAGASPALAAAALLHDVGHLVVLDHEPEPPSVDLRHEAVGARYLARRFPPSVTAPIALHVAAKRYLTAVEPTYLDRLSEASIHSLVLQGGPMDAAEIVRFEAQPGWADAVTLRRWDDAAKDPAVSTKTLAEYHALLAGLVTTVS